MARAVLRGAGDSLFHNNGDGTFTDVSKAAGVSDPDGYYGMGVIWADFNNTGRPDIYVANDSTPKFLYKNLGNGTFKDIGLQSGTAVSEDGSEQASMGIAVGDYNHTGRPSLYVTNFSDENDLLYRNDGDWNFTEVSYPAGVALPSLPWVKWGTAFVDLDNDGWLDLITVSGHVYPQVDSLPSGPGYREPKLLSMNQKDGTFCDASDQAGPALKEKRASRGLAVGDLFNDGNMDVVVGDIDGAPMILRNHGVPGRHWVSFELAGGEEQPAGAQRPPQDRCRRRDPDRRDPQRRQLSLAERPARALRAGRCNEDRQPGDSLAIGQGRNFDQPCGRSVLLGARGAGRCSGGADSSGQGEALLAGTPPPLSTPFPVLHSFYLA